MAVREMNNLIGDTPEFRRQSVCEHSAEVIFALLPFLVLLLIFLRENSISNIFALSEWSFGACLLFGQSLVKLVGGMARAGRNISVGVVRLYMTLIIVFGLTPSLVLVIFAIDLTGTNYTVPVWVQFMQVTLFLISVLVFFIVGIGSDELRRRYDENQIQ